MSHPHAYPDSLLADSTTGHRDDKNGLGQEWHVVIISLVLILSGWDLQYHDFDSQSSYTFASDQNQTLNHLISTSITCRTA